LLEVPLGPQLVEELAPLRPRVAGGYRSHGRVSSDIDSRGGGGAEAEGEEWPRVAAGSGREEGGISDTAGAEEGGAQGAA
jgi:hypothetical protein